MLAFVLNLIPVGKVGLQDGSLVGSIKLPGRVLNLMVLTFISLLLTTIVLYLLAENFQIFAG